VIGKGIADRMRRQRKYCVAIRRSSVGTFACRDGQYRLSARALVGMDDARRQAENVVTVEGEITEGYLFIDSRQDANIVIVMCRHMTLVRRHVRLSG